ARLALSPAGVQGWPAPGHRSRVEGDERTGAHGAETMLSGCVGRPHRRTQRYWPCEILPRKDCLERGRGDFADKEGIAGSALIYSAGFGMRENLPMQQIEVPRRGPARSRSRVHLWPLFPWFLTAGPPMSEVTRIRSAIEQGDPQPFRKTDGRERSVRQP